MKSLLTLIKLTKMRVDEQRQMLAKLQERLAQIENDINELHRRQAIEQDTVQKNPATALTYGDFVRWAIERGRALEKQRLTAAAAVNVSRDKLAEVYAEQKRYELAAAAREAEKLREEQRQETAELDEVGNIAFMRRKGE